MGIVVAVWWGCSGKPSFLPCKEPACTALPQQALRRTIGAVQRLNRKECEELWLYFTAREDTVPTAVSCIVPAEMYVHWSACFTTRIYVKYFDYWPCRKCSARYNNLESSLFFIESLDCILYKSTMDNGLSCRTNAMRRMYGSEAHGLHRLITQRVFIVSLTVYKMNSDDKANGNDNRSVSSWQFRKWITMTNNLCQFAFVIIRAICKIDVVDQIDQILVNVCCIDLRCYFV